MAHIDLDIDAIYTQVMQTPKVKAKVRERATKIGNLIRRDLSRAGISAEVKIVEHYNPNGRASMNVEGTVTNPADARRAGRIARRAGRSIRR